VSTRACSTAICSNARGGQLTLSTAIEVFKIGSRGKTNQKTKKKNFSVKNEQKIGKTETKIGKIEQKKYFSFLT
jgi:hypothetical protein